MPAYRMAIDWETKTWKPFVKALSQEQKAAFEELMDACRTYAMEASNATKRILFEPMLMSMLLGQQKDIMKLEKTLAQLRQSVMPIPAPQDNGTNSQET